MPSVLCSEMRSFYVTHFPSLDYFTWYLLQCYAYQSFIYSPTDALVSCLKKNSIKIYIKTAPKFSMLQLHHHQGGHYFVLT